MAGNVPFFKGENSTWKFVIGGKSITIFVKSWEVSPDVTKINDGVCGENRDRLDRVVNYYNIKLSSYMADASALSDFLDDIANDDTGVQPTDKGAGCVVKPRDGSKAAFTAENVVLDDWKFSGGGRADRVMLDVPLRCTDFKKAQGL